MPQRKPGSFPAQPPHLSAPLQQIRLMPSLCCLLVYVFALVAPARGCITQAEIDASQSAWAGALESIGRAWTGNDPQENAQNCEAAKSAAEGALAAAYAYESPNVSKVLFKPTLTSGAYTFRDDRAGALSYFVGECAGKDHIKQDGGFALGYSVATQGDRSTYMGFEKVRFHAMSYQISTDPLSPFCHAALAQGKMTITSRLTGEAITVDKTFAYVKNPSSDGAPLLLTAHHSSLEISAYPTEEDGKADGKTNTAYIMSIIALSIAGVTALVVLLLAMMACVRGSKSTATPSAVPAKAEDRV